MSASREPRDRPRLSRPFRHALACLSLAALAVGTFAHALRSDFVDFDDYYLVMHNARIRSLSWEHVSSILVYRSPEGAWLPARELSYSLDYAVWGLDPFGFHLTNLALHAANVLLVYALLCWLLRRQSLAWLAAAWWVVHPVQAASVAWVSGRRDVLYGFFFLLAFLSFVGSERRWRQGRSWAWLYAASLVCLLLSLLSKAAGMMLFALLALVVVMFEQGEEPLWQRLLVCLPHAVITAGVVGIHLWVARQANVVKSVFLGDRLPSVPYVLASYWRLALFPVQLSTPYARTPLAWPRDQWLVLGTTALLAAVVAAVVAAVWRRRASRQVVFCVAWWFLMLLPVSNLVPLSNLLADRYLYLPLVALCALGAELVGRVWSRGRRGVVLGCALAVVAVLAAGASSRARVWSDSLTFWRDGVAKWPGAPVPRIGMASASLDTNRPEAAWWQYMHVVRPSGMAWSQNEDHLTLVRAGVLHCYDRVARRWEAAGRHDEALDVYETVVRLMPNEVGPRAELVRAYERRGRLDKAREQIEALRKLDEHYEGLDDWLRRLEAKRGGPTQ